jgi:hypothetical protein
MAWTDNPYSYTGVAVATIFQSIEDNFTEIKKNFAAGSAPSNPAAGQLWFDTATNILKIYYSGSWVNIFNANTGALGSSITIAAANIGTGAVTEAKIGTGAVTAGKIETGAVTATKIGSGAVTEAKIGSGAVTEAKIGSGAVTVNKLGDLAVTAAKMANGSITAAKMSGGLKDVEIKVLDGEDSDYYYTLTFTNGVLASSTRTYSPGGP